MKQETFPEKDPIALDPSLPIFDLTGESHMLENLPIAFFSINNSGIFTQFNKKAGELWGSFPQKNESVKGFFGAYKLYHINGNLLQPMELPGLVCLHQNLPKTDQEILFEMPGGTKMYLRFHSTVLKDKKGQTVGVSTCFYNISEIKKTENMLREKQAELIQLTMQLEKMVEERTVALEDKIRELKKSEERYHRMIEEVEDYAIILLDKEGYIQNWNRGAEKIKGYREEEVIGKNIGIFYLDEDRKNDLHKKIIMEATKNGKALYEGWRMRKDRSVFWGSIVLTALHDEHKNVIGFSKVTRDLTERKVTEDKLKEYTSQLEFQNKELEQFAYAASHDMKEPLRKIHFYNSYIAEDANNKMDERSREYLNRSLNAVKRMSGLIEDLLIYSRTNSNHERFEEIDLKKVINEIAAIHKGEFEEYNVQVNLQSLPVIHAIPFQIKQLFENLLNNSIKYKRAEHDVHVNISCELVKGSDLEFKDVEKDKNYHKISFIDNGVGFQPQFAEKIFEIFQRLTNSDTAKGSGIGLAICKKIVQNHKGFINAIGTPGSGAQFDIYIPD